jgi:ABC-type antimicrobial peptide transport system permease subunit
MKDESPLSPMAPGGDGWLEVIGVVADARNDGLREPIKPSMYVPYTLKMRMFTQILVRTLVPPLSILRDVRAAVARVDHDQQVMRVNDLSTWITGLQEYGQMRLVANLFAIFSALALALSAVGLYSVVSYSVTTRTNEFGIRMALGAQARDVVRMVLASTYGTLAAGLGVGVLLSIALDKVASQWVTESARNPIILVSVTAVLLAVAALACLAPARRAATIDPMAAVRHE